jgi:hypothetical protein
MQGLPYKNVLSLVMSVLPHFPWRRFLAQDTDAVVRNRGARFSASITESEGEPKHDDSRPCTSPDCNTR